MAEQDPSQKTEEPTPRKLEQAREKGDVPKSQDVGAVFVLVAAAFGLLALGGGASAELARSMHAFLERPHALPADGGGLTRIAWMLTGQMAVATFGIFLLLFAAALVGNVAQIGLLWSGEKLQPKLDKISPIAGFKRLFGGEAWVNFAKTVFKVVAVAIGLVAAIAPNLNAMESLVRLDLGAFFPAVRDMTGDLLIAALIIAALIAGIDYVYQRQAYMRRNRMSREELKEEFKNTEGDPLIRAKLRQIRQEKARQRMMQAVPKATVVITNPTHYAVALRYVPEETAAPVCVAKGVDAVALRIRALAEEHKVTIMEDPPLARALYASVEIDQPIPAEHFQAVAKIIGAILRIANKGRNRP
jgi:flagellar biosynthesis protein FlhB